ncbi:MAG: heat-inducible transcriptional repressor HrcA [Candidatus Nitrosotenuis sp.]
MQDLTDRKERILRAVVLEYVATAEPVGSEFIVERYQLGVRPATVRHELAEMGERGYVEQPHTSSGRIPSDTGYRYYVDKLSVPEVDESLDRKVRKISQLDTDLDDLLIETCRLLSRVTQHVTVAVTLREKNVSIRNITLSGITAERVLMVAFFSNGLVEERIITAPKDITLADLQEISSFLTEQCSDIKLPSLSRKSLLDLERFRPSTRSLITNAWKAIRSLSRKLSSGKVVREGTSFLFAQPEFQRDLGALSEILTALEDETVIHEALESQDASKATVKIGKENPQDILRQLAVVVSPFHAQNEEAGAIAVLGPTRMQYSSVVPLVEASAKALSDALSRLLK